MKKHWTAFLLLALVCLALYPISMEARADAFSANVLVNDEPFGAQRGAALALDEQGRLHVVYTDASTGRIRYTYSTNNGTTYAPSIQVIEEGDAVGSQANADIAVLNDTLIVVWQEIVGGLGDVRIATRAPGASQFTKPMIVHSWTQGTQEAPRLAASDETIAVVWKDSRSDDRVIVRNSTTGTVLRTLNHTAAVTGVDFSINGDRIAASAEDGTVRVWNISTGALVHTFADHTARATDVEWSPDGTMIATSAWDFTIRIYNSGTYAPLKTLSNSNNPINDLFWSPDSQRIAVAHNGEGLYATPGGGGTGFPDSRFNVTLWNVTNETSWRIGYHQAPVNGIEYSPDGQWIATGAGSPPGEPTSLSEVGIWYATNGTLRDFIGTENQCVYSVSWLPDSRRISAGLHNGTVSLYDATNTTNTSSPYYCYGWLKGHEGAVKAVAHHPHIDLVASGGADTTLRTWNSSAMTAEQTFEEHMNTVYAVGWSPDGAMLASGSGNSQQYQRQESRIYCAASHDMGQSFVERRLMGVGALFIGGADVAVGGAGTIAVTWYDNRPGYYAIYYTTSTDGGEIFSPPVYASNYYSRNRFNPAIVLDGNGDAHLAWHDNRDKVERYDIYYASTKNGFATNVRVRPSGSQVQQQNPAIAVSEDGQRIYVAWNERSDVHDIKLSNSTDVGASFGASVVINDANAGTRDDPCMAMAGAALYIAWTDWRSGAEDVYSSSRLLSEGKADLTPPEVVGHTPSDGAVNVSVYTSITVEFSEPIMTLTFEQGFSISGGGWKIREENCSFAWSAYSDRVEVSLLIGLNYTTTYTVNVPGTTEDLSGNLMGSNYTWTFTTGLDMDAPRMVHSAPPAEIAYNQSLELRFEVEDYSGVAFARVYVKEVGEEIFSAHDMTPLSEGNYTYTISPQWALGMIEYYFEAGDMKGNNATLYLNQSMEQPYSVSVIDPYDPVILHDPVVRAPLGREIRINANVTDGIKIGNVSLFYKGVEEAAYTRRSMSLVSGTDLSGNWSAEIPAQVEIGTLHYYILAIDTSGNDARTQEYPVVIADEYPPTFLGEPTLVVRSDGSLSITVNVTDDHEVARVEISFLPVGGSAYIKKEMSYTSGNEYAVTILGQVHTGYFHYYIEAYDTSGNVNSTMQMTNGQPYRVFLWSKETTSQLIYIAIGVIIVSLIALGYILV
ncbi:MAG: Ig-like domain-containing protein, partial [Candidatus Thermoplasmatota archaeon]